MKRINFKKITLRLEVSNRGGGIEISLDTLGYPKGRMTAYQNYLGGGMLGSISNDCNRLYWKDDSKLVEIASQLAEYFHNKTNHSDDEWENATFEQTQNRPSSVY